MKQVDPRFIHLDDLVEEIVVKTPPQGESTEEISEASQRVKNVMLQEGEFS